MKYIIAVLSLAFWAMGPISVQAQTEVAALTTITVKVSGVGCSNDVRTIGTNVEKLEGVTSCEVEKRGATTRFEVSYNPDVACTDDIYQTIEDTPGCKNPADRPYRVKM